MEPEDSLPHSHAPANCPYPEADEYSPLHCPAPWRCTFNNTILSTLGSSKWFPFPRSPHQKSVCISPLPLPCSMPHPSHSPWFYHPNNIWWGVQIVTLLVLQLPVTASLLGSIILFRSLFSNILSLSSSLSMSEWFYIHIKQQAAW